MFAVDLGAIARHRESYSAEVALKVHSGNGTQSGKHYAQRGRVIRLITSDDAYSVDYARGFNNGVMHGRLGPCWVHCHYPLSCADRGGILFIPVNMPLMPTMCAW